MADPTGLHQVVTNLMLNGAEAIADGGRGTITLDAAVEEVRGSHPEGVCSGCCPGPGRHVVMSVSDTGVGMSEETRLRLFEPFFSTKFQGRGMGLAATLGIVRSHGGGITVESEPGVGTTFRVYWPVADASRSAEVALGMAKPSAATPEGRAPLTTVDAGALRLGVPQSPPS